MANQISPDEIKRLMEMAVGKTPQQLLNSLSPDQAQKIQQVMQNQQQMEKLLQTPQAKQIMKQMKKNS